ncbi:MAG: tetratricopeptide repeat protein [Verrucomicrobia bacterium]|nr:tetratricopeptide repeat protein [Verrucomicrobiota bacterium]
MAQNTNDFETTYHLARLHSMAYATNLAEVNVTVKEERPVFYFPGSDSGVPQEVRPRQTEEERQAGLRHLTNAIVLYQRAIVLLKKSTNVVEQQWLIVPAELGLAWCLDQAGRRDEALAVYRRTLKIAWKQEVTGDFDLKEWISGVWEDVRAGRNPIHARRRSFIGPGVCYSEEVIGYRLKLLDPFRDASEVAKLKKDQQTLRRMGRAITPVLVPIEPNIPFEQLVDTRARVAFDLDGSGLPRTWGWITPKAAWLVFDSEGSGQITSGLQMFGNVTFWIFWRDGYDALSSLDADGDGLLQNEELQGLALWHDRNGNGTSESGEVRPVKDFGIAAIACTREPTSGGVPWRLHGVCFSDGTSRPTYDWIVPSFPVETTALDGEKGGLSENVHRESGFAPLRTLSRVLARFGF